MAVLITGQPRVEPARPSRAPSRKVRISSHPQAGNDRYRSSLADWPGSQVGDRTLVMLTRLGRECRDDIAESCWDYSSKQILATFGAPAATPRI